MRPASLTMLGLVILALSAASTPAQEKSSPLPSYMPLGKEVCYGRTYDRNHLASHPRQRVTSFHLFRDFTPDESAESPSYSAGNLREAVDRCVGEGRGARRTSERAGKDASMMAKNSSSTRSWSCQITSGDAGAPGSSTTAATITTDISPPVSSDHAVRSKM